MAAAIVIAAIADAWYVHKALEDEIAWAINAAIGVYIAEQYVKLSEHYRDLYTHSWNFYNDNFQVYGESTLVDQVFNNPLLGNGEPGTIYIPKYAAQWNVSNIFRAQGGFSRFWWQNHANMYADAPLNFGCDPRGNPITIGEPEQLDIYATVDDADSYFYRFEEHLKDVYDERTWGWQTEALNYGVKQANIIQGGYATSFAFTDHASTNLSDWFGQQADGFMQYGQFKKAEAEAQAALNQAALEGTRLGKTYPEVPATDVIKRNLTPVSPEKWETWQQ
jgi:hypothetical protein